MITVTSLDQYKDLVRSTKKRFPKVITNCLVMSSAMAPSIQEGRLYCQSFEKGLAVYMDEGTYYHAYYYWDSEAELGDFRQDKPVLMEELSSRGSRDAYIAEFSEKLKRQGFERFKQNLQFEKNVSSVEEAAKRNGENLERLSRKSIRIGICGEERHVAQVAALWRGALDETDVPEKHFHFAESQTDTVLCAFNGSDEVVAACWWSNQGRDVCEYRHIVTREDYLRNGIARALIAYCELRQAERGVKKITTWISTWNSRSILLHEGAGFCQNGRTSSQFICRKEGGEANGKDS